MTAEATLSALRAVLDRIPVRWALIGALAANRYRSSPRMTGDVDLLLAGAEMDLTALEEEFRASGWDIRRADDAGELLRLRHQDHGIADLLIAGTEYQLEAINRAIVEYVDAGPVAVLTIEDVLLHKLIAGRYQNLADIEAILESRPLLDRDYLDHWIDVWDLQSVWARMNA